jgi:hypothetical protein
MNADGTQQAQLTSPPGVNNLASWGDLLGMFDITAAS